MITRRTALGAAVLAGFGVPRARAAALEVPAGKPILSVSGNISVMNRGQTAVFDLAMLEAMEQSSIQTTTPWFTGAVTFQGVKLTKLMQTVGAGGTRLVVYALNDYVSEIPVDDFAKYGPILAIKRDGNYMPVRDKGPLFIVYPYDSSPVLNTQQFYSRSPWQIARFEVK